MVKQGVALATMTAMAAGISISAAQQPPKPPQTQPKVTAPPVDRATNIPASVARPDYIIGPEDVLTVVFWRDKEMSGDVVVRPDGKISIPLLRDVEAAGSTPDQLRARLVEAATKYLEDPDATVVVKEIKSRNVYITGNVAKPGTYPISSGMNVLQCIALAGGVLEYADTKNIVVIRRDKGLQQYHKFNYNDVIKQKHTEQNLELKPGDTIVVP
jgi:polysaccharide export outer membrane protein